MANPLVSSRKVSGRGGWKQTHLLLNQLRELNRREQTVYEDYCDYCERIGCRPALDYMWYVINNSLPSV